MSWSDVLATAALVVSCVALWVSLRATRATESQAATTAAADHRSRAPKLEVRVDTPAREGDGRAFVEVTNAGDEDLDRVVVRQPETSDGVNYRVAPLGGDEGDEADLGPLPQLGTAQFCLFVGSTLNPPRFVVRVVSSVGDDEWDQAFPLEGVRLVIPGQGT